MLCLALLEGIANSDKTLDGITLDFNGHFKQICRTAVLRLCNSSKIRRIFFQVLHRKQHYAFLLGWTTVFIIRNAKMLQHFGSTKREQILPILA